MDSNIAKCMACGTYSYGEKCQKCGAATASPHPARFSPEDKYGHYRRRLKKLVREEASE